MRNTVAATALFLIAGAGACVAAPESYTADPNHTYASFEVSHGGNFTTTRGFFQKSSGKITLDRAAGTGSIEINVDVASMTSGHQHRDTIVRTEWLKADQFPNMIYRSSNLRFAGDNLTGADGELTLAGVSRPVSLAVTSFKCRPHPVNKKQQCGADGAAQIKRSDFGLTAASSAGDDVKILFQIEAYKE